MSDRVLLEVWHRGYDLPEVHPCATVDQARAWARAMARAKKGDESGSLRVAWIYQGSRPVAVYRARRAPGGYQCARALVQVGACIMPRW